MKKYLLTLIILTMPLMGGDNLYSASYLMLNPFPKVDALGGHPVSLSQGAGSYLANPALVDTTSHFSAEISQTFHFEDERQSALAISGRKGDFSGAVWGYIGTVEDIPYRDSPSEEPLYYFNADQTYAGISANYTPVKSFTVGASTKWIHETIGTSKMDGQAWDLGAKVRTKYASLGLSIRNIGDELKFEDVIYELPLTYTVGISSEWKGLSGELTLIKPDLLKANYNLGLSYRLSRYISFSAGFTAGHDTRLLSVGTVLSNWGFDLAYTVTPYRKGLGTRHCISFGI